MIDPGHFLPFANPSFAPDWLSRDDPERPPWPTGSQDAKRFTAYCIRKLDELDRRAVIPSDALDVLWAAGIEENRDYKRLLPRFLDEIGIDQQEYERLKRRERERLQTGRERKGPTKADPIDRAQLLSARAAHDMAKLRFVIYPRFWGRKNLTLPSVQEIASTRQGCKASAADAWFEDNGVRKQWADKAASLAHWKDALEI